MPSGRSTLGSTSATSVLKMVGIAVSGQQSANPGHEPFPAGWRLIILMLLHLLVRSLD